MLFQLPYRVEAPPLLRKYNPGGKDMKISSYVFAIVMLGLVSACTTVRGTAGNPATVDAAGDSLIKQNTEFKDLPTDMREAITHGG
jgi:hypothetical protein